ncbi:MAG: LysR family transcriptional regulator [Gammaproteobacteria bacterium]|nr:LysR family transcriptional regulator [Gammaproteobacteria bacterium]
MDIEQARTFLSIASNGSFVEAAKQLHLTQSTVSARIQRLEQELDASLFIRNRSGATLTHDGRRFMDYAKRLVLTAEQARHDIGLPERFSDTIRIGGRIALWENLLPLWVGRMRQTSPGIAIRSEIGFEEDLMRNLIEGALDIGLMYTPGHSPGLIVEQLFDENLVLVSSRPDDKQPGEDYIYVEWGPGFYNQHTQNYPQLERPAQTVNIGWLGIQLILSNGGSCYLPERMAKPYLNMAQLFYVTGAPTFKHPAYAVYPRDSESTSIQAGLQQLREVVRDVS